MDDESRVFLTFDEAMSMLPDGEHIHVMIGGNQFTVGADWEREHVVDLLKSAPDHGIELSGSMATSINHGGACFQVTKPPDVGCYWFIETKQEADHD